MDQNILFTAIMSVCLIKGSKSLNIVYSPKMIIISISFQIYVLGALKHTIVHKHALLFLI